MEIPKQYTSPAILLGNGINIHENCGEESYKSLLLELAKDSRIDEKYIGKIDEILKCTDDISYPEFYDALNVYSKKNSVNETGKEDPINEYTELKVRIQEKLRKLKTGNAHEKLVAFAMQNELPILTTNFDTCLLTDSILEHYSKKQQKTKAGDIRPSRTKHGEFTHRYPVYSYYSNREITNALENFGIWHIHGCLCYRDSILLGISEYFNFKKWLEGFFSKKGEAHGRDIWNDKNSWLDILFHKNLVMVGLALGSQEIGFRWLLKRRYNYSHQHNLDLKTLYVEWNEDKIANSINAGKKFFLESLDIEVAELSGAEIYDNWTLKNGPHLI
jgi:hypothetical protein